MLATSDLRSDNAEVDTAHTLLHEKTACQSHMSGLGPDLEKFPGPEPQRLFSLGPCLGVYQKSITPWRYLGEPCSLVPLIGVNPKNSHGLGTADPFLSHGDRQGGERPNHACAPVGRILAVQRKTSAVRIVLQPVRDPRLVSSGALLRRVDDSVILDDVSHWNPPRANDPAVNASEPRFRPVPVLCVIRPVH